MKKSILNLFLLFMCFSVFAQNSKTVHYKQLLKAPKDDSTKVLLLDSLSMSYNDFHPDSGIQYIIEGLELAKDIGFKRGEALCLIEKANLFDLTGNYSEALKNYIEGLHIAEQINNSKVVAKCLGNIGLIYSDHIDNREALKYYFRSLAITDSLKDSKTQTIILLDIGATYYYLKQYDSSLYFQNRAYELSKSINDSDDEGAILTDIASIQIKLKNPNLALAYYYQANEISAKIKDEINLTESYNEMAELFYSLNQRDSAEYYGLKSLKISIENHYRQGVFDVGTFLYKLYEKEGKVDSAYKYLKITKVASDSLFNEEKLKQVQLTAFNEKALEAEQELQAKKAEEKRKHNLQLLAIGVFILTFIILVIALSKVKIPHWLVKSLGVLALLLVFEFISLLLEPLISKWTNDTPMYTLGVLVAIAAILVPTHHKLEHWVKEKLAKRKEQNQHK